MNTGTAKKLLESYPLTPNDTIRLILELCEELGEQTTALSHNALMSTLRKALRKGVEEVKKAEMTVPFAQAIQMSLEARKDLRPTSRRNLRHYTNRMLRVAGVAERPLRSMSVRDCRELLAAAFPNSAGSYHKGRAILHSIFAYGIRQEWCDSNPVNAIEAPRVRENIKHPLSTEEVHRLLKTAQQPQFRDMRFALHLMLYNGIRPTEVSRLHAEDIDNTESCITIRPQTSKTGGGRLLPLRVRCKERILPANWSKRWREFHIAAGFKQWVPDILRHTFASYHAAYFRNMAELQQEMGHRDISLLRSRYISPVSRKAAIRFWSEKS